MEKSEEEMTILHIAHVGESRLAGVNVAVPAIVQSQEGAARVGFLNLTNVAVPEVANQLAYAKGMRLEDLPEPFCKPDLIVFHELYRPAFLSLSKQARAKGIPYVIVPHGGLTDRAQKIKAYKKIPANFLLFNRFIRGAAEVQCLSQRELEQTRLQMPKFIGTNGTQIGPVKTDFFREGLRFSYIGRLDLPIKGLDLLMEALCREKDFLLSNGCHVDLYGPDIGNTVAQLERYRRNGLGNLLSIHGPVSGAEKEKVLSGTDCYIQTSRSEGMSMGILEAMGRGIPCLVTEGTGMADLVREYRAGWGCDTDKDAIGDALHQAVLERDSFPERAANARTLMEERFTWERVTAETIGHYTRMISQGQSM